MQTCPEHCLVLQVSWSSFLVWNHWAMFMNGSWWRRHFFPRHWPFGQWSPVNSLTKASDAELWYVLWSALSRNHEAADLGRHRAHYDVIVLWIDQLPCMAQAFSRNAVHEWYGRPISNWPNDVIWRHTPLWRLVQVTIWTDVDRSVSAHDIRLSAISTINH